MYRFIELCNGYEWHLVWKKIIRYHAGRMTSGMNNFRQITVWRTFYILPGWYIKDNAIMAVYITLHLLHMPPGAEAATHSKGKTRRIIASKCPKSHFRIFQFIKAMYDLYVCLPYANHHLHKNLITTSKTSMNIKAVQFCSVTQSSMFKIWLYLRPK